MEVEKRSGHSMNKDTEARGMCISLTGMCVNSFVFFFLKGKSVKICPEAEDTSEVDNKENSLSDLTPAISLVPVCVSLLPSISIHKTQIGKGHQVLVPYT